MLTSEMIATELLTKVAQHTKWVSETQTWCKQAIELEKGLGRDVVTSRWQIQCDIQITKAELPIVRKIVGRLTMVDKSLASSTPGNEKIGVTMKPLAKEWDSLRFTYTVKYRAGKCKIVDQPTSSYKTLVCGV